MLHLFGPDIDWTRHYVSDFANGRLGSVFVFGAAVHGLGNLALSVGLRRSLAPGPSFAWAVVAAVAVVGLFFAVLWNRMPGLAERLALASFLVWELGASLELARSPSSEALSARHPDEASQARGSRTRLWRKAAR